MFYEKGLNHLKSLVGQSTGNAQCYAVAAVYSGIMKGPDLGAGTYYNEMEPIEGADIYSASEIGNAYHWDRYGWEVITNPDFDKIESGSILCFERSLQLSDEFITHEYYGHCAVVRGLENGLIQTYEQKGELGEIVAEYEREYLGNTSIVSMIIPPFFDGEPTEFIHGQATIEEEKEE
ncbi:hypothetical protein K5E_25680 [Enterococcus thailandicus]|uniref:CHAP domain-containing protein n=1 Tax=Enterococcus thailandicus TaxID=417368 RepID=UPI00244D8E2B|nr:CHAP domain-containing protein [Enterococcus thailandicus]GMC10429.1 hypothetical protein K5E_25680 [Enterococcus thailandicus]